uniref:Uncharacterized protein n=1 Tax=Arundo donax TaxID=35708 RepID=A0A0A8XTY1_ARUDO
MLLITISWLFLEVSLSMLVFSSELLICTLDICPFSEEIQLSKFILYKQ